MTRTNNPNVQLEYAHFLNDLVKNELGKYPVMKLGQALKIAKRMIENEYVQVRLTGVKTH